MDRRQQKTRAAIFDAFSELLAEKSYSKITVQEIIDAANVGRTTFYAHFETKDDLLKALCEELFGHILSRRRGQNPYPWSGCPGGIAPESMFCHLLQHLQENDRNILGLLSCESSEIFLRYFKDSLSGLVRSQLAQRCKRPDLPREFLVNHVSGSFVEMVLWWIKGHMRQTPAGAGPVLPGSDGADPVRVRVSCADGCILTFPCYNKSNHRRKRAKGREKEGEPSFFPELRDGAKVHDTLAERARVGKMTADAPGKGRQSLCPVAHVPFLCGTMVGKEAKA